MKLTNEALLYGGLGVLSGLVIYNQFLRSAGDKAKVGDEVLVPPSLVQGAPANIDPRVQFVIIKVTGAAGQTLTGQLIGTQGSPVLPVGPVVNVLRKNVTRTVRKGRIV